MSYSQVFDVNRGKLIGYLGDLSLIGAMIIGDEPQKTDEKMTISIQLPELPDVSAKNLVLRVRIAWCHQDLSPEYFNVGMEFSVVTDDQKKIIESIIENYEFRRQIPNYPPNPAEFE
jgi:hypothetical protein